MNDPLLPNKMTKSYLLESDPYLKTSSKSSPFALNSEESVFRAGTVWNGNHHSSAIPNELLSDRPTVKPLAMHNVPSNVPPIAYINGNSVRPVRCRHYSQQQTVLHHHNNSSSSSSSNSEKKANSGMHHYAESNENGVNNFSDIAGAGDSNTTITGERDSDQASTDKNGFTLAPMAPKSLATSKVNVQSATSSQQQRQQSPSKKQQRAKSPSRQSSSSSIRDYVTNNENEASFYNLYENTDQVIEYLAKRIESVLRLAKENRRLVCNELLVPQLLTSQIAADVIEMAECEPCGLRGCHLYICIEDTNGGSNSSSGQSGLAGISKKSSSSDHHSHHVQQANSSQQHSLSSRLLGEVSIDRSVVPTFEVFLTLKRIAPNWFESLENKILGKERIVLSELYLVHKKKLYQTSSPNM